MPESPYQQGAGSPLARQAAYFASLPPLPAKPKASAPAEITDSAAAAAPQAAKPPPAPITETEWQKPNPIPQAQPVTPEMILAAIETVTGMSKLHFTKFKTRRQRQVMSVFMILMRENHAIKLAPLLRAKGIDEKAAYNCRNYYEKRPDTKDILAKCRNVIANRRAA